MECLSGEIFDVGTGGGTLGGSAKGGGTRLGGRGGWLFSGTVTREVELIVVFSCDCFVDAWLIFTGTIGGGGGTKVGMDFLEGDGGGNTIGCSGGEECVSFEALDSLLFIKKPNKPDFLRDLIVYDQHIR